MLFRSWRTITAENPKAKFVLQVGGFDDDPRELWEFPEVCAYVQRWANLVGLDTLEDADKWVGSCEGRLASPLTDDEFQQVRMHAHVGAEIVGVIPHSSMMREAIEHHHQRFDGSGYPDGLRGEEIPQWARIIALTDTYANMVTEQSFSSARTPEQALDELAKMSGTRFDGMLVRLLLRGLKSERTSSSSAD